MALELERKPRNSEDLQNELLNIEGDQSLRPLLEKVEQHLEWQEETLRVRERGTGLGDDTYVQRERERILDMSDFPNNQLLLSFYSSSLGPGHYE